MRLTIEHSTRFRYDVAPSYGLLQLRMAPQGSAAQKVHAWDLELTGARRQARFQDQHSNWVDLIELLPDAQQVEIKASGIIETLSGDGILGRHFQSMPLWFYLRQTVLTQPDNEILALLGGSVSDLTPDLASLHALSHSIRDKVAYTQGATQVSTRAADALARAQGVCQDHAHIFLSAARAAGLPARYVSGYLMMDDRIDQDASHAWAEVYLEGLGWVAFDISNGISPDQRYVRIAHGLDYADVAPSKGVTLGAQRENLIVSIQVQQ